MTYFNNHLQKRIDEKLSQLQKLRPLPPASVAKLKEQFSIEMTYNSNAIEGNKLTLKETFLIINEGITIKGKPLRDHIEAKDHYEAINYLYDLIGHDKKHTFSEVLIRNLQRLITKETDIETSGAYRNSNVIITGSKHTPPEAYEVSKLMRGLVEWVRLNKTKLHPVELAAILHHKLVYIHPFFDGNGRTARLLMNVMLMQSGYPLVVILKNDRKRYYQALERADKGDLPPFVNFIAQAVERSLNIYLKTLFPAKSPAGKYFPLSVISKQTPYSEKYLNLLARQGKIEAHKEGRNWVATIEAVKRYIANRERQK
ncbi:MAG: cell filamentation protein Fic [Candidatus Nealsonbacteria bacterium RIFCSPLOWO2_01_FULL_41_9]|uniref:Cell filamentation protein Fic n=1 Tax=Candidatus Nealsonbacteria bacterium RIFCSPLOWO2_01_FULL_41_9 TaxID=1801671 RepID=A0A1G2EEN8_9BACT|nr:MAG: cell filamentation protein Fic [Candidatus Nealsonbacteria bacterium RIFCSPLOWO2_01_FULL_41_9]